MNSDGSMKQSPTEIPTIPGDVSLFQNSVEDEDNEVEEAQGAQEGNEEEELVHDEPEDS